MTKRIKGKCKYCGKEYTFSYMSKHLATCEERKKRLESEAGGRKCGYFELAIYPRYSKDYWLFIEVSGNATLKDIDTFLRDIWVECCNHLSAFNINGVSYEDAPVKNNFWGMPLMCMNCKLKSVLEKGMTIGYEYDFGSTTELVITVLDSRSGFKNEDKLTILSRNNPYEFICSECGKKTAVNICCECMYDDAGYLCEDCSKTHECGEEMLLNICNSPRMGVCGYVGSYVYPDQFLSDIELMDNK